VSETCSELVDGRSRIVCGYEVCGLDWIVWLWGLDLRGRDTTATGNFYGHAAGVALGGAGDGLGLGGWDVEGIELTASSWLNNRWVGWVVGDVVPVHDVIVPVALTLLHDAILEAKGASP